MTIKFTLPIIENENGLNLNLDYAHSLGNDYKSIYLSAAPFPSIIFDNFLPEVVIDKLLSNFPNEVSNNDYIANTIHLENLKRGINPSDCNYAAKHIFSFFNSPPILKFLEGLTDISNLVSDPYFLGGGYHEIKSGGKLSIHADFRSHKALNLQRRINMLIYLNKNWHNEFGGNLELWDDKMLKAVTSIEPIFNRCVIFNTDEKSYHGHPDPLKCPENITRKSVALYYYNSFTINTDASMTRGTDFKFRKTDSFATKFKITRKLIKTNLKEYLIKIRLK
jgi:hypothetical protein